MVDDIFLLVKKSCLYHPHTGERLDENHSLIYPLGAYTSRSLADEGKRETEERFRIEHINSNGSTPDIKYDILPVSLDSTCLEDYLHLLAKLYCIRDSDTGRCIDNGFNGVHYIKAYGSKEGADQGKVGLEKRVRQEWSDRYGDQPHLRYEVIPVSVKG